MRGYELYLFRTEKNKYLVEYIAEASSDCIAWLSSDAAQTFMGKAGVRDPLCLYPRPHYHAGADPRHQTFPFVRGT